MHCLHWGKILHLGQFSFKQAKKMPGENFPRSKFYLVPKVPKFGQKIDKIWTEKSYVHSPKFCPNVASAEGAHALF